MPVGEGLDPKPGQLEHADEGAPLEHGDSQHRAILAELLRFRVEIFRPRVPSAFRVFFPRPTAPTGQRNGRMVKTAS